MTIVHDLSLAGAVLKAERAREYAAIHEAACRYRAQALVCSTCDELDERAARMARVAGGCQVCGEPHGVSVPCGFRRTAS